ncbi:ABC transporter ATP-binding protein [soil metagenome]
MSEQTVDAASRVTEASRPEVEPPLLEVDDLAVEFRTADGVIDAVDGLSYIVTAGRTLAIVGESGCGKSVSSLAVMGLLGPTARVTRGAVRFRGTDLLALPPKERRAVAGQHVAMVFQDALAALNPVHTVGYQLTEALRVRRGIGRREARRRAIDLLDMVRVPRAADRIRDYPHQFSGGMRQRVVIAAALAMDPQVFIADEPTTALDVTVQAQILRLLAEIQAERRMGLVLITHDLGVVASVADDVTVMYAGHAVEQATVDEIFAAPAHPYTRALLRAMPRLALDAPVSDSVTGPVTDKRRGGRLDVIPGRPPRAGEIPVGCPFHPRCDAVLDVCRTTTPPLVVLHGGRSSRCHVATDVLEASGG